MKICKGCKIKKEIKDFYVHVRMTDGHLSFCKECVINRIHDRYINNLDEMKKREKVRYEKRKKCNLFITKKNKLNKQYRKNNPEKYKAHALVGQNLKSPNKCEWCKKETRVHGHHEDYSKPLDVIWLCPSCHRVAHRRMAS